MAGGIVKKEEEKTKYFKYLINTSNILQNGNNKSHRLNYDCMNITSRNQSTNIILHLPTRSRLVVIFMYT